MARHQLRWVAMAGLAVLGLIASTTAVASADQEGSGGHCVAVAQEGALNAPADFRCFDTLEESFAYGSGVGTAGKLQSAAGTASSSSSVLLGIEYTGSPFTGDTLVLYGNGSSCWSGGIYGFPNLGAFDFNNVISSAKSYNGCVSKHYDDTNYGTPSITCYGQCSSMGSMNNRASSIIFLP